VTTTADDFLYLRRRQTARAAPTYSSVSGLKWVVRPAPWSVALRGKSARRLALVGVC
jgi:hypothetical protein